MSQEPIDFEGFFCCLSDYSIHFSNIKCLEMGLQRMVTINNEMVYHIDFVIPFVKSCLLQNNITKKEKKSL